MKRGDSVQFGSRMQAWGGGWRGLFSLVSFLPDVAEGGGGVWQNWFTARKGGVGRAWQPDGVRDARVGREAMKN